MEEYKYHGTDDGPPLKRRPDLLTFLCIMTFISSGIMAFSNLLVSLSYSMIMEMANTGELNFPGMDIYLSLPLNYFLISFVLYAGSVFGAARMWNLRKIGFHIYTVSQIAILIIPSFYEQFNEFPLFNVLLTAVFILLYATNLKHMTQ